MKALSRLITALPDAFSAACFLYAWLWPLGWYPGLVKNLVLVILMEFLVVHSGGFLGVTLLSEASRAKKTLALLGLSLFYMAFVAGFCLAMGEWWPVGAFLWLLGAKFVSVWFEPKTREEDRLRLQSQWAFGVMFYLGAVFAGVLLPLPRLGLSAEVVPQLQLPGGGLWIEQPHTAIVAGVLYFCLLALMKFGDWRLQPASLPKPG